MKYYLEEKEKIIKELHISPFFKNLFSLFNFDGIMLFGWN